MPLETSTTIAGLNALWPLGTDSKSQGDDHLRLIKSVLQSDAVAKADLAASSIITQQILTTSGTYTKPAGLKYLEVYCVGGGGGSGAAAATPAGQASAAGGGGAGGVVQKFYAAAAVAATQAYTIGAAGAAGIPSAGQEGGGDGGSTTFAGLTAGGGLKGGWLAANTTPGNPSLPFPAGGTATGGDINMKGGDGNQGISNSHGRAGFYTPGPGGANYFAEAVNQQSGAGQQAGKAGNFPGGGAAGGGNGASIGTNANGAVGGAGCIILREYF
jgi:hypothetical protein